MTQLDHRGYNNGGTQGNGNNSGNRDRGNGYGNNGNNNNSGPRKRNPKYVPPDDTTSPNRHVNSTPVYEMIIDGVKFE